MSRVTLAIGTAKGLFYFRSDASRRNWTLDEAPALPGWEVSAVHLAGNGRVFAGTVHYAYGATVRASTDGGKTFTQPDGQPKHREGSDLKMKRIWQLCAGHASEPETLYCGVDEAALFVSRDMAKTWSPYPALNDHPTRGKWFPGAGGLCLHTIIVDRTNKNRIWCGVSAAGMFGTTDGGETWASMNTGIKALNTGSDDEAVAHCIHKVVQHPSHPDYLVMQFHGGLYRSRDGAKSWQSIEKGVPSNFGFPMVCTKRGDLFIAPLADNERFFGDGKMAIYRSRDIGEQWTAQSNGLPAAGAYTGVLRDAMCVDDADGVYFGTTSGDVYATADAGDTWHQLPGTLPRILCVRAIAE
jgi:photosystem II stability/assembly factor-like uncharacterized protein